MTTATKASKATTNGKARSTSRIEELLAERQRRMDSYFEDKECAKRMYEDARAGEALVGARFGEWLKADQAVIAWLKGRGATDLSDYDSTGPARVVRIGGRLVGYSNGCVMELEVVDVEPATA